MLIKLLFNKRNFRYYFYADLFAGFGAGMSFIGCNWFILKLTGSSASVGLLMAINITSGLIVFPFAGTIADRFNRRSVIAWSNLVRAFFVAIVAILFFRQKFNINLLYFLGVINGIGWVVFMTSSRAFVQELLESKNLLHGNSLMEISMQIGIFMAAGLAGFIYKYWGFGAILVIDAATFLISNYLLRQIKYEPVISPDKAAKFFRQFVNGLTYLLENPLILGFGTLMFLPFVASLTVNVVMPSYVSEHLGRDSVVFGIADMFYGIGACISGVVAARFAEQFPRFTLLAIFFLCSTASLFYLSLNNMVLGLYLALFAFGFCNASIRILMNTVIMQVVPVTYMGRAMAVWLAISMFMQAVFAYSVGVLIEKGSAPTGFAVIAAIMIVGFVLCGFFYKKGINFQNQVQNP